MLQPRARWKLLEYDEDAAGLLSMELKLSPLVAKLLAVRGITKKQDAVIFLNGGRECFHDPFLLKGMHEAVPRIRKALENKEKIRIYGDYDADGVSSTVLMIFLMRYMQADFDYYIPHRTNEGYGLNTLALDRAKEHGVSLIITVDTGISACVEIEYARKLGIDVIVTDHHEPPEVLPSAYALINPKQPDCSYPFKRLAGVGVVFKLAHALVGHFPEEWLEIAVIGTVADLMPLVGENRELVKQGLLQMRNTSSPGIRALCGLAGIDYRRVTATNIGFALAPRINASGRLENANQAVELLTTTDEQEAEQLAYTLDQLNKERQYLVEEMTKEALAMLAQRENGPGSVIVVAQENWNVGVVGITASRVLEKFYRPTLVLSIDPKTGLAKGSARSIAGFNLYEALTECKDLLEHYGGHQAAAGLTLHRDHLAALSERLAAIADRTLREKDFQPVLKADMECDWNEVTVEAIRQIEALAPFGMGNPAPRFVFRQLQVGEIRTLGRDHQHLKLSLSDSSLTNRVPKEALAFGKGAVSDFISGTATMDIVGEMSINEWNGVMKPQILIQDMHIPKLQVFDWRGKVNDIPRLSSLLEKLSGQYAASPLHAVVLSYPEGRKHLPACFEQFGCSLWTLESSGNLAPLNEQALAVTQEQLCTLFLFGMPTSLTAIESLFGRLPAIRFVYALFSGNSESMAVPSREAFKNAYAALLQLKEWDMNNSKLMNALSRRTGLSTSMIQFIIETFEELSFITKDGSHYRCVDQPVKKELTSSRRYKERLRQSEMEQILTYSTSQELTEWVFSQLNPPAALIQEMEGIV